MLDLTADALVEALRTAYPHAQGLDDVTDEAVAAVFLSRRRVLAARYLSRPGEVVPYEEVARALRVSAETARSLEHQGLHALGVSKRSESVASVNPPRRRPRRELSPDEEVRLVEAHRAGDRDAGAALVEAYRGLIGKFALRNRGRGLDEDDLWQEGAIAFLRGVREKYDPARSKITTYLPYTIRTDVFRATVRQGAIVRLGHLVVQRLRQGRRLGIETWEGLVEAGLLSEEVARAAVCLTRGLRSADTTVDEEGQPLVEAIPDENAPAPDARVEAADFGAWVREKLLYDLNDRERRIAEARLMADPGEEMTLDALGQDLGLCRERVRQIEEKLKARLRKRWMLLEAEEDRPSSVHGARRR